MDTLKYSVQHEKKQGILYVTVEGAPDFDSLGEYTRKHISLWADSPSVLWDIRGMFFDRIDTTSILSMSKSFKEAYNLRKGWRTAYLVNSKEGFGLGRMVQAYATINNIPVDYGVFYACEKAEAWLRDCPEMHCAQDRAS